MIRFLFKGLLRDKSRSLLPVVVVAVGVMMTVFLQAYLEGILNDSIEESARLSSGHVKITTRGYHTNSSQRPNEYAVTDVDRLLEALSRDFADLEWSERIMFGGLLDAPDADGYTRSQGNVAGAGIRLIGSEEEIVRMDLRSKLFTGHFPVNRGEVLISNELFKKMKLELGDEVTLISSSMYGDMAMYNFRVCGTLHFGIAALDKGMLYADIEDVRSALYMDNAAGEILGFFPHKYDEKKALEMAKKFSLSESDDEFSLVLTPMSKASGMDFLILYSNYAGFIIIFIFVFAMSIVLWNAGLLGGLRRYGEFGLRLAIGESKSEAYGSLVGEAVLIGLVGSVAGTAIGLVFAFLMQEYGLDASDMIKDSTLMLPTVFRAQITPMTYFIGFIPGVLSTVIGSMLAGIGIYKRQTAQLFKELT